MNTVPIGQLKTIDLTPLTGSEVQATPEALTSGKYAAELKSLLQARGVLIFRGINLTDEQQLAFSETLGSVVRHGERSPIQKITLDSKVDQAAEYLKGSLFWHIDGTMNRVPIGAAILTSKVLPTWGGNTEFCNTYAAYDALSAERKQHIDKLRVVHSMWNTQLYYRPEPTLAELEEWMAMGELELPLVWKHRSGRKSLVLGNTAQYVIGMEPKESAKTLHGLREWATSEPFHYAHVWQLGDAVMWDNTGTMHRAMPYDFDCGRLLHRTKLAGEEPCD